MWLQTGSETWEEGHCMCPFLGSTTRGYWFVDWVLCKNCLYLSCIYICMYIFTTQQGWRSWDSHVVPPCSATTWPSQGHNLWISWTVTVLAGIIYISHYSEFSLPFLFFSFLSFSLLLDINIIIIIIILNLECSMNSISRSMT